MSSVLSCDLTLKVRKGFHDGADVVHTWLPRAPEWGVSAVVLHGRTRQQRCAVTPLHAERFFGVLWQKRLYCMGRTYMQRCPVTPLHAERIFWRPSAKAVALHGPYLQAEVRCHTLAR